MAQDDVAKLLVDNMLAAHSPLYRWLYEHYAEIAPLTARPRPPWEALAKTARTLVGDGTSPTRQAVRKTWLSVERDVGGARKSKPGGRPVV